MRTGIRWVTVLVGLWAGLTVASIRAEDPRGVRTGAAEELGPLDSVGTAYQDALAAPAPRSPRRPPESGGPGGGRAPGVFVTWHPAQAFGNAPGELEMLRQQLSLGGPVYRGEGDTVILAVGFSHLGLMSDALLPDSGAPLPEDLWNVTFNANYKHEFDNGWTGTLLLGLGSASDRPFNSVEELNITAGGVLRIPAYADRDAWVLSLMYIPSSTLNFPVPGVAYDWNPSEDFRMRIGIPFSLYWRPRSDVTVEASYLPLTNIRARITWQLTEPVSLFAGYDWQTEAYFLADRVDAEERFMLFEQRLAAGMNWNFAAHAACGLQGGYAVDRSFGSGRSQGDSLRDQLEIDPGPFVEAAVTIRW